MRVRGGRGYHRIEVSSAKVQVDSPRSTPPPPPPPKSYCIAPTQRHATSTPHGQSDDPLHICASVPLVRPHAPKHTASTGGVGGDHAAPRPLMRSRTPRSTGGGRSALPAADRRKRGSWA